MRKRVLGNVPHVRLSLVMLMALLASLAVSGCGGGGGGTPNPNPPVPTGSKTLATVTGTVTNASAGATPIPGAVVSIAGTSLKATTGADGKFVIVNVPVGSVGLTVISPNASQYFSYYVAYGALGSTQTYDSQNCPITITTQASAKGVTQVPYSLGLYPAGTPPPPPTNINTGCPK